MLIILRHQSYSTSTHTNCLIQFVKERFDQVFRLNRGRAFYSSLSICQAVFEEFFVSSQPLSRTEAALTASGRRILQHPKPLSTPIPVRFSKKCNTRWP